MHHNLYTMPHSTMTNRMFRGKELNIMLSQRCYEAAALAPVLRNPSEQ